MSLRVVKFIGLMVLGAGLGASMMSRSGKDRVWAACWLTSAGMLLTWCAGYGMIEVAGYKLLSPFVLIALVFSLMAHLNALLFARQPAPLSVALTIGGTIGAVTVMSVRPASVEALLPVLVVAMVTALISGTALRNRFEPAPVPEATAIICRWFVWLARLEGISLLLLLLVVMPLKRLAGLYDGGWTGWIHGALFMQYGLAVVLIAQVKNWGWMRIFGAVVAAFLPGGTFIFEWKMKPEA